MDTQKKIILCNILQESVRHAGLILKMNFGPNKKLTFKKGADRQSGAISRFDRISNKEIIKRAIPSLIEELGIDRLIVISEELKHTSIFKRNLRFQRLESAKKEPDDYVLAIDPICGSIAYARGIDDYVVSAALMSDNQAIAGVVYDPTRDEMFSALCQHGAFLNGARIHPSRTKSLKDSYLSIEHKIFRDAMPEKVQALSQQILRLRVAGTCGLELCYVACGRTDGLIKMNQPLYDYIAGMLILVEAGGAGFITAFDGTTPITPEPTMRKNKSFIATNGLIHSELALHACTMLPADR